MTLSHRTHAICDWSLLGVGAAAPALFGWSGLPAMYTYVLAAFAAALNLITAYPGGIVRWLPFVWHRRMELAGPGAFVVAPWFLFGGTPAGVLSAIGSISFAAALTTPAEWTGRAT